MSRRKSTGDAALALALDAARNAAYDAGKYLRHNRGNVAIHSQKAERDYLLEADLQAEQHIFETLKKTFPSYPILSEETQQECRNADRYWVVDPLDGSYNFQHGNPTFGISISLHQQDEIILGVTYLPLYKETYDVTKRHGARCNTHPIHVSQTERLNEAIVHVGDFAKDANVQENEERLKDIQQLANRVGRVRMIGTAATDFAWLACGRADGLIMHNAQPWDINVGRFLVEQAGGCVSKHRDGHGGSLVVCSNGHIHNELVEVVQKQHGKVGV